MEILSNIPLTVFVVFTFIGALIVIYCGIEMCRNMESLYVEVESGQNDNDTVLKELLKMVEEAEESLIMYDDGDDQEGSIYNSQKFIDAVEKKLDKNKSFEVRCLFNVKECKKLEFYQRFYKGDRPLLEYDNNVSIKYLAREKPKDDVHYKVIDWNRKAYLSIHGLGESERSYNIVDCTNCSTGYREHLLGKYNKHLQEKMQQLSS